uniref:Uncharacterized protein n=1 Tax=Romanomermis culicivorax TaxID=13658 RepID=A0A915HUC8_ROMCU
MNNWRLVQSRPEAVKEIFRPTFDEQQKTVVVVMILMTQKEDENCKLPSQDKLLMLEEDFQQPEKHLIIIETPVEIREAQRNDVYIAKLLKTLEGKEISTISSIFHTKNEILYRTSKQANKASAIVVSTTLIESVCTNFMQKFVI